MITPECLIIYSYIQKSESQMEQGQNTNSFLPHLSEQEALSVLKRSGPNILPSKEPTGLINQIVKTLKEPMLLLLVLASIIYFIIGDLAEGFMLGLSAFVVIGISIYQDQRSEKALEALKKISSPRALVIRDGKEKRIAASDVVPGDLIVLHEGDRVAVDGIVLESTHLVLDESLITGESFPVKKKQINNLADKTSFESCENINKVFSSTLVVAGSAFIRSSRTGMETEVGKIGKSLEEIEPEALNLSREIGRFVKVFGWSGFAVSILLALFYGFSRHEWLEGVLMGIATQMSLLPEEFPVVLSIFMAMGAWRLSKLNVLVRNPVAIERLGAITTLCVDKTGTLTENKMKVSALGLLDQTIRITDDSKKNLPEVFHELVEYGIMASHRDPFDPMEKAILNLAQTEKWGTDHIHTQWNLVREYPLSDQLLAMSCVWIAESKGREHLIATKGAPESVIKLCQLTIDVATRIEKQTTEMASQGLRVLGVAKAKFLNANLPQQQSDFSFEWVGLIGLEDPVRKNVPSAIVECQNAGVRVVMMTGDFKETALKIANESGINSTNLILSGADLSQMTDSQLKTVIPNVQIFARMIPEQKLRIVKALKEMGNVVAMTGDGVNDAPSLKWADIGIAMGSRGTDVAREASDIVLLDDNFISIVSGIKQGRVIYSNIKKAMSYIISVHVPIAGLSVLPLFFGWPLILFPAHIVFLELIIDPVCSLLFETPTGNDKIMKQPPRDLNASFFSMRSIFRSLFQGILVLIVCTFAYWLSLKISNGDSRYARSLAFTSLVLGNMILIFINLTSDMSIPIDIFLKKRLNSLIPLTILFFLLVIFKIEFLRNLFQLSQLGLIELLCMLVVSLLIVLILFAFRKIKVNRAQLANY